MLLTFARVYGDDFIWQTRLFEKERDFRRVRGRVVVKTDHLVLSLLFASGRFSPPEWFASTLSACGRRLRAPPDLEAARKNTQPHHGR